MAFIQICLYFKRFLYGVMEYKNTNIVNIIYRYIFYNLPIPTHLEFFLTNFIRSITSIYITTY